MQQRTDVLYFLHIEKTGGLTLRDLIGRQFPAEQQHDPCPLLMYLELPESERQQHRFISMHLCWAFERVFGYRPMTITLLRDPIERTLSHYSHVMRDEYTPYAYKPSSLRAFLTDPYFHNLVSNFQVNSLCYDLDPRIPVVASERVFGHYDEIPYPEDERLALAKQRLRSMAFVGIAEQFNETVQRLFAQFGWVVPSTWENLNVSLSQRPTLKSLPAAIKKLLRQGNALDFELYDYAVTLFKEHR